MTARDGLGGDGLWYKDAVFYELRVRSFYDSDGDGIGDLRGLAQKLDYLEDLGVTALWLLPVYPSPLKDDGYDIADYTDVHPDIGTLADFKHFLREARRRGLRVVTEMVLNHTSDQHSWFQSSRRAKPGERWRDFYVWSDTPEKYKETRILFQDFEPSNWSWDPVAKAYYWHRFYAHQPDLNFDSRWVRRAVLQSVDFWLGLGVDGLRLDAVPYLYEREGTNCENLPETHAFLRELRRHVDGKFQDRMLLAEANQWPEDAAAYFGQGDECHMAFHFPIMPRLFMAIHMENRSPILDILEQTPQIPEAAQWALFLRNHDELTLEMVTDEERDYMYRVYARDPQARIHLGIRRRLAPLLGNDRKKIELMNGMLFSLPGTPILYYGDEIGMGDNYFLGDRNGVRTPMQWSPDRNAGFSRANPQRLYLPVIVDPEYHYEAVNVENQQHNPHSLLWWTKRLIALRKRYKAFGRGGIEFLYPSNPKVLAFIRRCGGEDVLVVANLSRFAQYVELDLPAHRDRVAVELFGGTAFPPIGDRPYALSLGPHTFYWFSLEPQRGEAPVRVASPEARLPALTVTGSFESLFRNAAKDALEEALPAYLRRQRWFAGKARGIKGARIIERCSVSNKTSASCIALVEVGYADGGSETYVLPLAAAWGESVQKVREAFPSGAIAELTGWGKGGEMEGLLYDAGAEGFFHLALLEAIGRRRRLQGLEGEVAATPTRAFRRIRGPEDIPLTPSVIRSEQSNTSVVYGDRFILKLFRRFGEGVNPELEIGKWLTENSAFRHIPPLAGFLEYRAGRREPVTLAVLQGFVPNHGDAWQYTLDEVRRCFERALVQRHAGQEAPLPGRTPLELKGEDPPPLAQEMIGAYLEAVRLLGQRTGELHVALASAQEDPRLAPEPFTTLYQRSVYQSMRTLCRQTFQRLRDGLRELPADARKEAQRVLGCEETVLKCFRRLLERKLSGRRIRVHGDYHLGQVLYTGSDFVIMDFEGEPARSLGERKLKRSPLWDVAGMLRSFHYAASLNLFIPGTGGYVRPEDVSILKPWAQFWCLWVSATFLRSYLERVAEAGILPRGEDELALLLNVFLVEKAVYELDYELNNRPDWARIPLEGILSLLETAG
ncbi:MAG: maltose alpha-D-glucosyltransferase [Candidatus Tectomicrobia bacterium]|nr:maltose alpha-D-glucosyltransferase [Candidatus Tectomicrobia bacterium]